MNPLLYFGLFLKASLFSTGGTGNLPSLHADLLARGWATEHQFVESLAIAQISPGPNGLWAVCLGYLTNGWTGALLAVIAICLPPLLVLAMEKLYHRVQHHPAVEGFMRGLSLAVVGIFAVVLWGFLRAEGVDARSFAIAAASLGLAASRRVPIVVIILMAAVAGVALY